MKNIEKNATNVATVSTKVNSVKATTDATPQTPEIDAIEAAKLEAKIAAKKVKVLEAIAKNEMKALKIAAREELKESFFSLTQLCKNIATIATENESLLLNEYLRKNSLSIETLSPEFVAKYYPLQDENGRCIKKVSIYKNNPNTGDREITNFCYFEHKKLWSVSDVINAVDRFLKPKTKTYTTGKIYEILTDAKGKKSYILTKNEAPKN